MKVIIVIIHYTISVTSGYGKSVGNKCVQYIAIRAISVLGEYAFCSQLSIRLALRVPPQIWYLVFIIIIFGAYGPAAHNDCDEKSSCRLIKYILYLH